MRLQLRSSLVKPAKKVIGKQRLTVLVNVSFPAPDSDLQTSTDVCKSLKRGALAPFFIPASATEIHPQLPFLSDQLRHKNTGGTVTG